MNNYLQPGSIAHAVEILNKKEIIAYPTEAVFSVGCDPDSKLAVNRLLALKKRPIGKGLILIAANFGQLKPYVNGLSLTPEQWGVVFSAWPGPMTFVFPAKVSSSYWLTGQFDSLAVRVTDHPLVIELCHAFKKPLVSTSANFTGFPPCRTAQEVRNQFGNAFPVVEGETGGRLYPSEIRDVLTGKCLRKG